MGSLAVEPRTLQPPPRYTTVAWGILVGLVFAALCLWIVDLVATLAGVVGNEYTTHAARGPLDTPFPHDGGWSVAANVTVGIAVTWIVAGCVWDRVERATKRPASLRRIFAVVAVGGYVPYLLGVRHSYYALAFLAAAFLVRRLAVDVPARAWPRWSRVGLASSAVAIVVVPVSYGGTHPLWYGTHLFASGTTSATDWTAHRIRFTPTHDQTVRVGITIANAGRLSATLLGVTGGAHMIRVAGALAGSLPREAGTRRLPGTTVHPGNEQTVTLLLRLQACGSAAQQATLDRVTAHYRLGGLTLAAPVALAIRPTIVCPWRA